MPRFAQFIKRRGENVMNNTMIKLLAVAGALLLTGPLSFAGSEPAPGAGTVDGTPVIKGARLSIAPAVGPCGGGFSPYTGVGCIFGDLTIAGTCEGLPVIAALRGFPLEILGLADGDITDIVDEGLEGRLFVALGNVFATQNPNLQAQGCAVLGVFGNGRDYEIRKVKKFVNNAGVISAELQLVPQD